MIVNRPTLFMLNVKAGRFSVNLELQWVSGDVVHAGPPIGLSQASQCSYALNTFDLTSAQNVVGNIPPIRAISGVVFFDPSNTVVAPWGPGPLLIRLPDTGQYISIAQNLGKAVAATPAVPGIGYGWVSFAVPVQTLGTRVEFYKVTDINPVGTGAIPNGQANVCLYTYPLEHYFIGGAA